MLCVIEMLLYWTYPKNKTTYLASYHLKRAKLSNKKLPSVVHFWSFILNKHCAELFNSGGVYSYVISIE
jgi:hypothetical protein